MQGILTERDNVEERALFAYSHAINKEYYDAFHAAYGIHFKAQRNRFVKMKTASLITVFISIMIAAVLIAPLGSGAISIGLFAVFLTSTFELAQMMSWRLTRITSELANHRAYLRDLSAFGKLSETPGAIDLPAPCAMAPGCIEFCGVSFAYPNTDRAILKNLSLKLFANKHYAFVGINGAGKTTITKLLTGLYDQYTGDILVDGKNLREFTQSERKAMFSVVFQDFAKYQVSMADGIGFGNVHGATEAEIVGAAGTLGLDETARKLPNGLHTPLGKIQRGSADLSGGEWQRVAIARSLVSRAPIHILDEPTAALDPVTESAIYEMYDKVSRGKTAIFITHRLGAARLADEIFVIDNGCVAEAGSHSELMRLGGIYHAMYEAQRGWYA